MSKEQGFDHEIAFWKEFVKSERFLNNWVKSERNPEIMPEVRQIFEAEAQSKDVLHVLDIGSGVVSWVKNVTPNAAVTPCDPLANKYAEIFDYKAHGQIAPVQAFGEDLPFPSHSFDVVHISNALDHTQDPYQAIKEMERVCKKDGVIIIQGFTKEAEHENYQGLHQWNIDLKYHRIPDLQDTYLSIEGERTINLLPKQNVFAKQTTLLETKRNWFIFAYRNA